MADDLRQMAMARAVTERSDMRPFAFQWLDTAYQESILQNQPWDLVKKKICDAVAQKIEKQRDEPERMQMIYDVTGPEFKRQYFPDLQYEPFLLHLPNMNREQVEKLRGEANSWLTNQTQRVAKDVNCGRVPPGTQPSEDLCNEQLEFLQNVYEILLKEQDRYMFQCENAETLKQKEGEERRIQKEKEYAAKNRVEVKYRSASTISSVPSTAMGRITPTVNEKIENMIGKEPNFHCFQTETVALSVKKILQRDPKRFVDVAQRLHGRQLGATLRTYMWLDVLFKADRDRLREGNVEKMVRERFGKAVARGVVNLSLKRATHSPIAGLIENAVVETYTKTLAMRPYNSDHHLMDAARSLNVLYTYDRSYEPYLIHWLFPIQVAFKEHSGSTEHVYELAMYVDLVNQNSFPSWPRIFAMADQTLSLLEKFDREFYDHLKTISQKEVKVNPKEFMVYLIHQEKEKAQELLKLPPQSAESNKMSRELLADPLIFLRKWIGEGFVSVLDTPAVLFLWDQNFLQYWQGKTIENMCLTLLELLRYKFMEAQNYTEMKDVFLSAPCKLYTSDIQRSWIHIERGGDPYEVQFFNRQRPILPPQRLYTPPIELTPKSPLKFVDEGPTPVFAIKNIKVKLVVPADQFYKEAWLAQLDPENIKMMAVLHFSGQKLATRLTNTTPNLRISTVDEAGDRVMYLEYSDLLLFDDKSLEAKSHVLEGSEPFVAIRVDYLQVTGKVIAPMPLGWAVVTTHTKIVKPKPKPPSPPKSKKKKVKVDPKAKVESQPVVDEFEWAVIARQVVMDMTAGYMPQCVLAVPPTPPLQAPSSVLQKGSEIIVTVFDPVKKTPTGTPERIRAPLLIIPAPAIPPAFLSPHTPNYWVIQDPKTADDDMKTFLNLTEPFDFYIDMIRFLPDSATIVKVTGRFLKTGEVTNLEDIAAFPAVDSDPRNPRFNYRQVVNDSRHNLDESALLILRVYTVQKHDLALVVVGSCLLPCVRHGKINTGGFQLRLRNGMPDVSQGVSALQAQSMDNITAIPSCSILLRILPHEPGYRPVPDYDTGYYQSDQCRPNQSENNIFNSYTFDQRHPTNFVQVIKQIKLRENDASDTTDLHVVPYIADRTDPKRYLPHQTPAGHLDILQAVRYRIESGFRVELQAFGLPDGLWCQSVLRVVRGPRSLNHKHKRPDGFGEEVKKLTTKLVYLCAQKAPKWTDRIDLHCYFDPASYLLIELYGFKFQFKSKGSPKIVSKSGKPLSEQDMTTGWAVVPLFLNESLKTGKHLVPIFKGLPTPELLQQLTQDTLLNSLRKNNLPKFQSACFNVKLLDLQFIEEEFPVQPLPEYHDIVTGLGDSAGYFRTSKDESGKMINDMVLRYLPADVAKAGAHGSVFQKEQKSFDESLLDKMVELMKLMKRWP